MSSAGSITRLLHRIQGGDAVAWDRLYERLLERLLALARKRLLTPVRARNDAGDVVAMTLHSLFRGIKDGRFTRLRDRNDLWRLLAILVRNKAYDLVHKRPPLPTCPVGAEDGWEPEDSDLPVAVAVQGEMEVQRLLGLLPDDRLREIAIRVLEGYTQNEIAAMLRCSCCTVERKLRCIRKLWSQEIAR
jgi:DNA-directed RNA polymerase specialized sigma24 family protein